MTIPSQEMRRPNPATDQTGFLAAAYLFQSLHGKKAAKTRFTRNKTSPQPHLEGVYVHWVDEGVAVKSRHLRNKVYPV